MSILFMQVFADHDSSLDPIDVPRNWLWNLPRRTVYCGTSISTIFKGKDYSIWFQKVILVSKFHKKCSSGLLGLSTEVIQHSFWGGK